MPVSNSSWGRQFATGSFSEKQYLEEVFNLVELHLVEAISIREPAIVHQGKHSSINGIDGRKNRDRDPLTQLYRTQRCENGTNDNLEKHEEPAERAEDVVQNEVL